jgi:hypothetical protein
MTKETVPIFYFIPLDRKKAVSLKKSWLISKAKEITTPAHPARGIFDEYSLLIFDAKIFRYFTKF